MGHHHLNFGAETFFVELESFFAVTVEVEVWIDVHDEYLLSGRIGGTESNEMHSSAVTVFTLSS
jgi:hypothetical protein